MKHANSPWLLRASTVVLALLIHPAVAAAQLVVGPGPGGTPTVYLMEGSTTRTVDVFDPAFLGGVSVTLADVNGDGTADIIGAAGPGGGPHVRVLSGVDFSELASFFAYDPAFTGGVNVAAGDVDGDGRADIITGAGLGAGPHVQVFRGGDLQVLASFFAYDPAFTGGVSVAAGDVNGDGHADIITGAGPGGGPHVQVFSGADLQVLASFFAYDPAFTGGVSVAAGDVNGDGGSDIVTGAGPGGGPHVEVFSGTDLSVLESFWGYDPAFGGGVLVATGDINGDGRVDLILGAGPGGGPHVRIFSGVDLTELASFFSPGNGSGVSVGSVGDGAGLRFTSSDTTSFTAGSPGSFTITTAGQPPPTITSSGTLPAGVTFTDNGDGTAVLAGTPGATTGGTYPLTLTANNGTGSPVVQNFTLTVNQVPAFTSAAATSFTTGAAGSFTVTTTGFPLPTIAQGGAALPSGVTFVDFGNGTGALSGTPAAGTNGTYAITFTADNGVSPSATQAFTLTVSGAPTFTSANTATFTAGSAGTFTVTTVATPTAALSVSGTLPAGVTFVDSGTGTGTLSGTPAAGTGGTYPLTFTATNSEGSATQSFTLTVRQVPAITSTPATIFTVGVPGTFTVTTTGAPAPSLAIGGVGLPAGVTFVDNGNGTGTLSGTPAAGTGGNYALTFAATNSVGASAPQAFTLTVNSQPAFTSAATTTFALGVAGTFTVTTVGTPPATLSVGALPGGVTFVDNLNGTGTLSGTPASGTAGAHTLTFTATNGVGGPVTQTFTLNITEGPVITSASAATFAIGTPNSFTVTASGFPSPTLVQAGALPAGVTWVDNGNGTGTLSGTPAAGSGGSYQLTFTATNGNGSAVQNFTLTVSGSPAFTSADTTTLTVGTPGSFTVTAIGAPPPTLTVAGALPAGVTFVNNGDGTGTLSGTPAAGTGGAYALTFTAANGVLPDATQAFTLNVNEAPAITSAATVTFTAGVAGSFTVTTSGFPLPTIALGGVPLPAGVTFVNNGNGTGTLSGTPAAGTGGSYALSFTASNTVGSSPAQAFTLSVNQAPAITSANTATFTVGAAGSFTVTASGSPAPTLSVTGALPTGVTFTPATGVLSGTPAAGTGGAYALTVTASNGVGANATQAFTLTVNEALTITSANATTFVVGIPGSFTVTTTGFPVATLTLTGGTLPAGVTFAGNSNGTATLSGTATAPGVFVLEFTAANGIGAPAVQGFTLTVNQPPSFTSADATTFTEDVPGTFTVTAQGTPAPALTVTGTLPAGVTFIDNGGGTATLSGTAAAGGTFPLTITANNGVGSSATQAFTLTVNEVNDAPSFAVAGDPPAVNEDAGPQTVAAFATAISAGPPNEAGQMLTFVVQTNSNPGLFSVAPAVSPASGALTYTSATNAFGQATITLVLQDNGGTANGGVNTSAPQTFIITVLPVNDAPLVVAETFQVLGNTELRVDLAAGTTPHTSETTTNPNTVQGVLDNDGDPEGDPFAVTAITGCSDTTAPFDCTLADGAVISVQANGAFSYTPGAGDTVGSFTYTVTDTPAQGTAASINGTVTFTIVEMVWYVTNNGAAGTGTSRSPLNTLTTLNGAGGAGDVDDGNDYIFVDFGDGTSTGQAGGLELEAGQQLLGEFVGLSIPVNLNGNGSPTVVVPPPAGDACSGGPCRPLIGQTTGNALSVTEAMPATIRGFRLAGGSAGNAIDVTTDGALSGSGTLTIADNVFQGAGLEGIDLNLIAGTTGTLALVVQGNVWDNAAAHVGNAIDINRLAGTLNLTVSNNLNIESAANAVVIDGGAAANTNIVGFTNNTVHTDTLGAGMLVSNVTFDAVPGGAIDQVAGGVTTIGVDGNGVGAAGLTLTNVLGSLGFTDLDVYGASGLAVTGVAAVPVVLTVVPPGSGGTSEAKGSSGAAVNITNAAINLQLAELASTTSTAGGGVTLTTVSGTFSAPTGSTIVKNGGGGAAFTVNNSAAGTTVLTATYAGTINNTSGTGGSVNITTADAGSSVSFTGAITDNPGTGISLTGNTGATVSFSGGLTLNGANSRFAATGGGTVTVTGTNTIGATTAPSSGVALNVANTTIGASGLTFRSVSANGAASGIVLDTTGSTGGFSVTGDGNTTQGGNSSGGLIQNTTGVGISLTNAANVSFNNMHLNFTGSHGVNGTGVMNFSFTNGKINEAGTTGVSDESCVSFDDLNASNVRGTFTFTNSQCTLTEANGIDVQNWGATLSDVTISGNLFTDKGDVATPGSAVLLISNSSPTVSGVVTRASLTNNTITDFRAGAGFVLQANSDLNGAFPVTYGVAGSATNVITVTGNSMDGGNGGIGNQPDRFVTGGINARGAGNQGNYNVSNNGTAGNRIRNIDCIAIELQADGPATVTTTVQNNFINPNSAVGCAGIAIGTDDPQDVGAGSHTTTVSGNNVMGTDGPGIFVIVRDSASTMNARVLNNTVAAPIATNAARAGIRADSGSAAGNTSLCLQISGNTTAGSTNTATATTSPGINLRKQGTVATTNVFGIVGLSPSPTGTPTVENYVNGLNTSTSGTFGVAGTALLSGTSGFVSCTIP